MDAVICEVLQLYVVAPLAVKIAADPEHTTVGPDTDTAGEETVTASVLEALVPQVLAALTLIVPLAAEEMTAIVLLLLVPVQPDGRVQLYIEAPGTGVTL